MLVTRIRSILPLAAFILVAAAFGPGCGGGGGTIESLCSKCSSDSPVIIQHCIDEAADAQTKAETAGCGAEFQAVVDCEDLKGTCKKDGKLDPSACQAENGAFETCSSEK